MPKTQIHSERKPLAEARWKIHASRLLQEIAQNSGQPILRIPIQMIGDLLHAIGTRAAQLNDPILNDLMCKLTIYTIADPESPDYDPDRVDRIQNLADEMRGKPAA